MNLVLGIIIAILIVAAYSVFGVISMSLQLDVNNSFWSFQWVSKKSTYVRVRAMVFVFWPLSLLVWLLGNTFFFGPRALIREVANTKSWNATRDIPDSEPTIEPRGRHYRALPEVTVTKSSARSRRKLRSKNW